MAEGDKFSILYKTHMSLNVAGEYISIPSSDVISIMIIHDYDHSMYPIIRFRLYTDLEKVQNIMDEPDMIEIHCNLSAAIYKMNDKENKSPEPINGARSLSFNLKGYIENKNPMTSKMDQYDHGIKRSNDLNDFRKVPIEVYGYDDGMIHYMQSRTAAIYKDMTIQTCIESMFRNQGDVYLKMDTLDNQYRYNQVLLPNLNITQALGFFDSKYGMYHKGAQVYGYNNKLIICSADVDTIDDGLYPIYVESYKSSSDMGGVRRVNDKYCMNTKAENVSVVSETDIERVLNGNEITDVNVNDLISHTVEMTKLKPPTRTDILSKDKRDSNVNQLTQILAKQSLKKLNLNNILVPDILHKAESRYIAEDYYARLSEKITRMDISGVGFDIGKMDIKTRYNVIFDSPIRGASINQKYRASRVVHVISNLDADLFIAQTTMNICSN
jgi:hypothetical protein